MSHFEDRTQATIEAALERACENLSHINGDHDVRRFVARRLITAAEKGEDRLLPLTAIARKAVFDYQTEKNSLLSL